MTQQSHPLPGLRHIHAGKVRDLYAVQRDDGSDAILLVARDTASAFDVVLPTLIPDKGKILTQLSLWWFEQLSDLVPHHVITADVDEYPSECAPFREELRGRSMLVRPLEMVRAECIARAYLSGSGTVLYEQTGGIADVSLPPGLAEGSKLPQVIFTPTTKADRTEHDAPLTYEQYEREVGDGELAAQLRDLTIAVLGRAQQLAERGGIIVADTKVEFGLDENGRVFLADEVLTPDSSRFWLASAWQPGQVSISFDKQPLRDYLDELEWDKKPPGPALPADVVDAMRTRYIAAYERLTGRAWESGA